MRISCYAQASGRVQGVGFRYFVLREATQRGIGGWVRNCEDGSVQMLLQGEMPEAAEMVFANNPLSVICSLVCDHEKQCEGHCVKGIKGEPVHAFAESCGQILLSFGQCRYTNRLRIMV